MSEPADTTLAADGGGVVNSAYACRLLMCSRQRLDQLVADGWIKRVKGKIRRDDLTNGYARWAQDENRRANKQRAPTDSRITDARLTEAHMRIAEKVGRLVAVEDFDEFVDALAGIILTELGALPARFSRDLNERRRLEKECYGITQRLADCCKQTADRLPATRTVALAFAGQDAGSMGDGQSAAPDIRGRPGAA